MTKKSTKRALALSLVSLLTCVSMFVGSTFAWFTDTASTTVNTIVSGSLDVQLLMDNGTAFEDAAGKTISFADADQDLLWEPGVTYNLQDLKIKNNGNLALKYKVLFNATTITNNLSDVITVTVGGQEIGTLTDVINNATVINEGTLLAGVESKAIEISFHMMESAGNTYQNGKVEGMAVTVLATQYTHEKDSTTDQYDKYATYYQEEVAPLVYTTTATLDLTDRTVKSNGENGAVWAQTGAVVTIEGEGTLMAAESSDHYAMAVWAQDGKVVINDGNFIQETTGNDDQYDLVYASKNGVVEINGGSFKSATPAWTLNVKDADRATAKIIVKGGEFYEFDPSNNLSEGPNTNFVAAGYKVRSEVRSDGTWYIVEEA